MREPKTPCSPIEDSDYLDLDEPKKSHSYTNLNPSLMSAPLPPPPPPPGMCIPFEYMNIMPSKVSTPTTTLDRKIQNKLSNDSSNDLPLAIDIKESKIEENLNENSVDNKEILKLEIEENKISRNLKIDEELNVEGIKEQETDLIMRRKENEKKETEKRKSEEKICGDVVDGVSNVDIHDYMNIKPSSDGVQIVGAIQKKAAPPVPPRCKHFQNWKLFLKI